MIGTGRPCQQDREVANRFHPWGAAASDRAVTSAQLIGTEVFDDFDRDPTRSLLVADHDRAISFYRDVFGMQELFRDGPIVFLSTPEGQDSLALHLATTAEQRARIGQHGGWEHFGIHLPDRSADGIDAAVARVRDAGGQLLDRGEHAPGVHYAYVADPDGYTIEI